MTPTVRSLTPPAVLAMLGEGSEPTDLRAPGAFPAEE
jgi:hypothetical protein